MNAKVFYALALATALGGCEAKRAESSVWPDGLKVGSSVSLTLVRPEPSGAIAGMVVQLEANWIGVRVLDERTYSVPREKIVTMTIW